MYKETIIYKDSNNNGSFLRKLFIKIETYLEIELNWSISNIEVIPLCIEDSMTGELTPERQIVYDFQQKVLKEFTIGISNKNLVNLLKYIKTVYYGTFKFINKDNKIDIIVLDGDIIEIQSNLNFINKLVRLDYIYKSRQKKK